MDEISWQRCGRAKTSTCRYEHLNDRIVERDIFPYADLKSFTDETAIWHFDGENCGASRRLEKISEIDADQLRGRTIKLHPVYRHDLVNMYADLTRRNVRALLDSVESAFWPTPPMNSLIYRPEQREVPLVGHIREKETSHDGEQEVSMGEAAEILLNAIDGVDGDADAQQASVSDNAGFLSDSRKAATGDPASDTTTHGERSPAESAPSINDSSVLPEVPSNGNEGTVHQAHLKYFYDWKPSFKVDRSKWTSDNDKVFDGTNSLADVYADIASSVERRLDSDKHADSKGPLGLIAHGQALLISAHHKAQKDFVKDWAMRLDDNGRPRVQQIQDLHDDGELPSESDLMHFTVQERDTLHQELLGIEPELDAQGEELPATAVARYHINGPFHYYRVGKQLFDGESTSDCRLEPSERLDSRVCLSMRARDPDDHRGSGPSLLQIRTWLLRDLAISDVDTAELAKEPWVDGTVFAREYRDIWNRSPKALRARLLEHEEQCRENEQHFRTLQYCFRTFSSTKLGIGVRRLQDKQILVAARYVNHFKHIDHLIEQNQYRHLNQLKLAAQSIDFSGGRQDLFGDFDSYVKIVRQITDDMCQQKRLAKLFKEPLAGKWRLELWVLPQIAGSTKLYRFTGDSSLCHFLDPGLFVQGDLRLFMEVHVVPRIAEEKVMHKADVIGKRERAKVEGSRVTRTRGGRK